MTATKHSGSIAAPPDVRWRAGADGIGHAYPPTGRQPALCGTPWTDPRWDHPVQLRHDACMVELNRLTMAALRIPTA